MSGLGREPDAVMGLGLCEFAGFDQSCFGVLADDFEESEPRRCPAAVGYESDLSTRRPTQETASPKPHSSLAASRSKPPANTASWRNAFLSPSVSSS